LLSFAFEKLDKQIENGFVGNFTFVELFLFQNRIVEIFTINNEN